MSKPIVRRIVHIDEDACIGCELCVTACHEGAIVMQNGKARLLREDYCDGLGDCLPACPAGAITFEIREAAPYDEDAVKAHLERRGHGCAGIQVQALKPQSCEAGSAQGAGQGGACPQLEAGSQAEGNPEAAPGTEGRPIAPAGGNPSELRQWPVQIKLVPVNAPFFNGADLLIAADCTGFACGDFHRRYMRGRVTLIGCTKLDDADYAAKLADIFALNEVKGVTVTRMDVPCCGGMENAVREALRRSGKAIPLTVVTLGRDGRELAPQPQPAGLKLAAMPKL